MENVKLGAKIFEGVEAVKLDTTDGGTVTFEGDANLQEKTVTENGVVTPDEGYDGLSKVVVSVEAGSGLTVINLEKPIYRHGVRPLTDNEVALVEAAYQSGSDKIAVSYCMYTYSNDRPDGDEFTGMSMLTPFKNAKTYGYKFDNPDSMYISYNPNPKNWSIGYSVWNFTGSQSCPYCSCYMSDMGGGTFVCDICGHEELATCPDCGAEAGGEYDYDMDTCTSCGRNMCPNCGEPLDACTCCPECGEPGCSGECMEEDTCPECGMPMSDCTC